MTEYCITCGAEIIFRHKDGILRPIHLNGDGCVSGTATVKKSISYAWKYVDFPHLRKIGSTESYLNPNAICPVCGKTVYFFVCPNGGRVFFDDVGWPWPKHPCTDNEKSQILIPSSSRGHGKLSILKSRKGDHLKVYKLTEYADDKSFMFFRFSGIDHAGFFWGSVTKKRLQKRKLTLEEFKWAPSFLSGPKSLEDGKRRVSFISAKHQKIVSIKMTTGQMPTKSASIESHRGTTVIRYE